MFKRYEKFPILHIVCYIGGLILCGALSTVLPKGLQFVVFLAITVILIYLLGAYGAKLKEKQNHQDGGRIKCLAS
jgi:membrane protein implicated in regulation of membrane protease activity